MASISGFIKFPSRLLNLGMNYITIWRSKVNYKVFPVIYGKIILKNNGYCELGKNVVFRSSITSTFIGLTKKCSLYIDPGARLIIEDNAGFSGVTIYCSESIHIGRHTNFGGNVSIWDTDFHPLDFEGRRIHDESQVTTKPVKIGDDVFVGANAMILKGVNIGDRSIIGAGSVVTKNIPSDEIWAGNPAKFIKKIIPMQKMIAV